MALTFDFAFEGFRTIRERPKLILFWGATALFGNGLAVLVLVAFSGPALATMISIGTKPVEEAFARQLLGEIMPGIGAWLPVQLLTLAVINGAVCRAGLGEGDDRFGFLQFGFSEIRIFLLFVIRLILAVAILFVTGVAISAGAAVNPASETTLQMAGLVAAFCAVMWLEVRLSLSVPQSFATRRLDIFGSFALTRGRFWPLFWGYLAATGLGLCVTVLCSQIIEAILGVAFGTKAAEALPDMTSLQAFLTPQTLTDQCLFNGLAVPLVMAILLGAPVAAYRALAPLPGPVTPDTKA
ncbi:MAG TPA: hypothetical protein VG839_04850 [Asticcacaulis sp.]|nr:hypothetical protein [Asticcacaulis sp.]